jgi:adhesin/invasin
VAADPAAAFRVAAPAVVASGQPFQLTVTAIDQWGNTASTYSGTVHFSSTDLGAQLPDDYPFGTADGGAHTFGAALQTPGPQTILIQDTSNASLAAALNILVTDGSAPFSAWWNHHGLSRRSG